MNPLASKGVARVRKSCLLALVFAITVALTAIQCGICDAQTNNAKSKPSIKRIAAKFTSFDLDSDGTPEIDRLKVMKFGNAVETPLAPEDKLVLVFVEERLLDRIGGSQYSPRDVRDRLSRFKADLKNEGLESRFLACDVYSGPKHQDGQTLLALRRFLKEVDDASNLQGVVLVGSFPEATIVRRWIWNRRNWNVTIAGQDYKGANQKDFLRIVPEAVAPRADIVLADLDGNWENIYVKEKRELQSIEALPSEGIAILPEDGNFQSTRFNDRKIAFEDFFWIQEDDFERVASTHGVLKLKLNSTKLQNPEISADELQQPNPLALPDILVSRINARHIAVMPSTDFRDLNRKGFLDREGKPQAVTTATRIQPKNHLTRNSAFERQLLIEYFDRNHAFRTETPEGSHRTASVNYGRGLATADRLNKYMSSASPSFESPLGFNNASLLDYVQFAKSSARLKGCSAHSSQWNSHYGKNYDLKDLEIAVGGQPWRWKEEKVTEGFRYTPSLAQQAGTADSYIHRTIYESSILQVNPGSLFIHIGCEVNTPGNALKVPYSDIAYGSPSGFQNAESILFFLNGVALASRAKTFYDSPRGFPEALGKDGSRFGDGWKAYFQVESNDKKLKSKVASNKRTYPWSIIGDWTLQLN